MDPNFRRLRYCRYADDFLVGVIGSKADAVRIMADIQHFLADRLNLTVSPEKTGVRDASRDRRSGFPCAFTLRSPGTMAGRQAVGGGMRRILRRPTGEYQAVGAEGSGLCVLQAQKLGNLDMRNGRVRPQLMESSLAEIIVAYNSEFRGFANYYAIADGVKASLDKLELVMLRSLFATVACRRRSTRRQAEEYLKMGSDHGVITVVRGEPRVHKVWKLKHLIVKTWDNPSSTPSR
jgi:RNA-directed DNA polymerase